jgi:hypothetical protein
VIKNAHHENLGYRRVLVVSINGVILAGEQSKEAGIFS